MKLSVIIPSYESQDNLEATLKAIEPQVNENIEIIVVDCSATSEVDQICNRFGFVQFIKETKRFNPGKGRNIGAKYAQGDYLVFLDSDVILDPRALELIGSHASNGFKVFGGALELNTEADSSLSSYIEHYYFNHESQASRSPTIRSNLSSALMVIAKSTFENAGGFSDLPRMQDTELTERLVSDGLTLYFFPDIVGYQIQDSPLKKVLKKIFITGNNLFFLRYQRKAVGLGKLAIAALLPFLMLAKITRINYRNIKFAASPKMIFVLCPMMYLCGVAWMAGFYKGIFVSNGIDTGR